jgi:osmotically-inducible protein OsmY
MPRPPRVAESYDEILRRTVVEPDSSFRPTQQQEKAAYEGTRIMDADEQRLFDRVSPAVSGVGDVDTSNVKLEIERDRVILRGSVREASAFDRLERAVHGVDGVGEVVNYLVVESSS